jgi:hypothetical protein
MTGPSAIGVVICRVGAVLLFIQAANQLGMVVPTLANFGDELNSFLLWLLLMLGAPFGAGLALWFGAERICSVVPDSLSFKLSDRLTAADLLTVGIVLLGLHTLFYGVISAAYTEASIWLPIGSNDRSIQLDAWNECLLTKCGFSAALSGRY